MSNLSGDSLVDGDVAWREYDIHESGDDDLEERPHERPPSDEGTFLFQKDGEELEELKFPIRLPPTSAPIERRLRLTCQEDYTQSTGMAIWKGSEILAEYLMQHPELVQEKTVLELGAGVGLVGLVAYHLGPSRVVLTDGDQAVLNNLRENVQRNFIPMNDDEKEEQHKDNDHSSSSPTEVCPQLIWGNNLEHFKRRYGKSRVILGTDLFYMTKSLDPLFQTVDELLASNGIFVTVNSCASQSPMSTVLETAEGNGLTCVKSLLPIAEDESYAEGSSIVFYEDTPIVDVDEYEDERIYIFERR